MVANMITEARLKTTVYTCTFSDYDVLLSPLKPTPGVDFVAFCDRPQAARRWRYAPLPSQTRDLAQNMANRYCKLHPAQLLPECDVSIYADGNILILDDLSPLIEEFVASDADFALFPGQHDRTVAEEIELTLERNKVQPEWREGAQRQLADLRRAGRADLPVTMNGVLFRRHGRPRLDQLMEAWWEDLNRYAMRDQYGLPGLLLDSDVTVHRWDWQYFHETNRYFFVHKHRYARLGRLRELGHALRVRSQFVPRDRALYAIYRRLGALGSGRSR